MSTWNEEPKSKIYNHEQEGDFLTRAEARQVVEFPARALEPQISRKIAAQRQEHIDDEESRVMPRWSLLSNKEKAVLAAIATAIVLPVGATLNSGTVGEGLVKRAHQLEHVFGLDKNK